MDLIIDIVTADYYSTLIPVLKVLFLGIARNHILSYRYIPPEHPKPDSAPFPSS